MITFSRPVGLMAAMTLGTSTAFAGDPTMYHIVTIPMPEGALFASMADLNNSNQVSGQARAEVGIYTLFYSDGETIWLDELPGNNNSGLGINDSGRVTGWVFEWGVQWTQVYIWDDGVFDLPDHPQDAYTWGYSINDHDQAVGFYIDDFHPYGDAFVYTPGRGYYGLGLGQATDINNAGMIVGSDDRFFGRTSLWVPNDRGGWDQQILPGLLAYGINESGTMIAGTGPFGLAHNAAAVFVNEDGRWVRTDIGGWDPDMIASIAHDVNDSGQVVGEYSDPGEPADGFIYENEEVTFLNDRLTPEFADWHVGRAVAINESGHILAEVTHDGVQYNAILVPDELSLLAPRPGVSGETNTFISTGATEGELVHFVYAFATGSTPIPGCPDMQVDLRSPQIAGTARGDANGEARLTSFVPRAAAGRTVYLQTVEQSTCSVSNLVKYTFR